MVNKTIWGVVVMEINFKCPCCGKTEYRETNKNFITENVKYKSKVIGYNVREVDPPEFDRVDYCYSEVVCLECGFIGKWMDKQDFKKYKMN